MKQLIYTIRALSGSITFTIITLTIGLPFVLWYSTKLSYHIYKNKDKPEIKDTLKVYDKELPF